MEKKKEEGYERVIYEIKNGEEVEKGKMKVEKIGVKEMEEKKIKIKLKRNENYFIEIMKKKKGFKVKKKDVEKFGEKLKIKGNIVKNGN